MIAARKSTPLGTMLGVSGTASLSALDLHDRIAQGLPPESLARVGAVEIRTYGERIAAQTVAPGAELTP